MLIYSRRFFFCEDWGNVASIEPRPNLIRTIPSVCRRRLAGDAVSISFHGANYTCDFWRLWLFYSSCLRMYSIRTYKNAASWNIPATKLFFHIPSPLYPDYFAERHARAGRVDKICRCAAAGKILFLLSSWTYLFFKKKERIERGGKSKKKKARPVQQAVAVWLLLRTE